jgi:hypothetical protein
MHGTLEGGQLTVAIVVCVVNTVLVAALLAKIWLPDLLARRRGGGPARR